MSVQHLSLLFVFVFVMISDGRVVAVCVYNESASVYAMNMAFKWMFRGCTK